MLTQANRKLAVIKRYGRIEKARSFQRFCTQYHANSEVLAALIETVDKRQGYIEMSKKLGADVSGMIQKLDNLIKGRARVVGFVAKIEGEHVSFERDGLEVSFIDESQVA